MKIETQKQHEKEHINFVTTVTPELIDLVAERVYRQWLRDTRRERLRRGQARR